MNYDSNLIQANSDTQPTKPTQPHQRMDKPDPVLGWVDSLQ